MLYFSIALTPVRRAALFLADGSIFVGNNAGAPCGKQVFGELVFNTGMTGYQESLTDPSYAGQVLCFSYPLIGNYGISKNAFESTRVHPRAVVMRESCLSPNHFESQKTISAFLEESGVPAVAGVDTRSIVLKVREEGAMGCCVKEVADAAEAKQLAPELCAKAAGFDYAGTDYVLQTAVKKDFVAGNPDGEIIVLLDYGAKSSIVRDLSALGFKVIVANPQSTFQNILDYKPIGVVASNGPGDPSRLGYAVECIRGLLGQVPFFGVCLGHQLLGQALGAKVFKLKFGHRGGNQPVQEASAGKCFLTSQNHGYAVGQLPHGVDEWFVNLNDGTNEGIICEKRGCKSVQFHPEANPGPCDAKFLFKQFAKGL